MWNLEYGAEEAFFRSLEEHGQEVEALANKPYLEPDRQALLNEFMELRDLTAPSFSDIGRISLWDMRTMYETGWWNEVVEWPYYFETMHTLDKALRKWYQAKHPPKE